MRSAGRSKSADLEEAATFEQTVTHMCLSGGEQWGHSTRMILQLDRDVLCVNRYWWIQGRNTEQTRSADQKGTIEIS